LVAKDILRVLYAPHKVFKDIIQKPGYLGPFILLIIFVLAQVGGAYVVASRSYIETTAPQTVPLSGQGDLWTEDAALWKANEGVTVSNNTADYINSPYSTTSIEFTASNTSNVWMELNNVDGSVNCGAGGFQNVSFRVKQLTPDARPENVSLYLYSLNVSNFYYDLTSEFSNSVVNVWNNITLTTGVGSEGWVSNGATWENITGLKLDFTWSNSSNVDLRVDDLFFKGDYEGLLELYDISYLANAALNAFAPFLFEWLLLSGFMYLMIKGLKGNVVWKPLMVAVGFALITIVIQALILAVVFTSLPELYYPIEVLAGVPGEFEVAYQVILDEIALVTLVGGIIQVAVYVWTIALGTFIVRAITGDEKIAEQLSMGKVASDSAISGDVTAFSWMKCLLVSGASLFLTIIILGFLSLLGV
jgi:hypothetical protein